MGSGAITANSALPSASPTGNAGDEAVAKDARWTAGWATAADETALLELFARAFGHAMPPAQWRWKYAGLDPLGTLVRRDGRPVAFYGGMSRQIRWFGTPATAVQIGDVIVDPAERGVLTPVIEQLRRVALDGLWPDWSQLLLEFVIAGAVAWAGARWFAATRKGFADVI